MTKKATPAKSIYPTELVEKAKFEMAIFERVSAETGNELIAEVLRLRVLVESQQNQIDRFEADEYNRQQSPE